MVRMAVSPIKCNLEGNMQVGERRCSRTCKSSADARVCEMTRAEINLQNVVPAVAFCLVGWPVLGLTICTCE